MTKHLKRLLLLFLGLTCMLSAHGQELVTVKDAIAIFSNGTLSNAKSLLSKQEYTYKGITGYDNKSYTWCKRVNLSSDYLPKDFQQGISSIFELSVKGDMACLYIFNRATYEQLKNEAKKLGYEADKKKEFFFKEDAPYILFLELGKPFPYLMQISK